MPLEFSGSIGYIFLEVLGHSDNLSQIHPNVKNSEAEIQQSWICQRHSAPEQCLHPRYLQHMATRDMVSPLPLPTPSQTFPKSADSQSDSMKQGVCVIHIHIVYTSDPHEK